MPYRIAEDGYAVVTDVFGSNEVGVMIDAVSQVPDDRGVRSRGGVYAVRNLLELSPAVRALAEGLVDGAKPVRGTLFDKTAGANWLVPWHQDLTICVAERMEVAGYGPWTRKAGVWHVQPPVCVLDGMVSVRIHLDDCDAENGALRVLPGTHRLGRLNTQEIAKQQRAVPPVLCEAKAGDVLLMKPLLVHASSPAVQAVHRRVIHIDYAASELDGGLHWRI